MHIIIKSSLKLPNQGIFYSTAFFFNYFAVVHHDFRLSWGLPPASVKNAKIYINIDILSGKTDTGAKPDERTVAGWLQSV